MSAVKTGAAKQLEQAIWFDPFNQHPTPALLKKLPKSHVSGPLSVVVPRRYGDHARCHSDVAHDYRIALYIATKLAPAGCWVATEEELPDVLNSSKDTIDCIRLRCETADFAKALEAIGNFAELYPESDEDDGIDVVDELGGFHDELHGGNVEIPLELGEIADTYMANCLSGWDEEGDSEDDPKDRPYQHHYWSSFEGKALGLQVICSEYVWIFKSAADFQTFFNRVTASVPIPARFDRAHVIKLRGYPKKILYSRRTAVRLSAAREKVSDAKIYLTAQGGCENPRVARWRLAEDGRFALAELAESKGIIVTSLHPESRQLESEALFRSVLRAESDLETLREAVDLSESKAVDWASLSDEAFEQLAYDLVHADTELNAHSLRKLGTANSRDGGRDLEFWSYDRRRSERRRWIGQCKLVRTGKAFGTTQLDSVSDIIAQYDAGGYLLIASSLVESTVYDRLEGIGRRDEVMTLVWSKLELERKLFSHPTIRRKYFSK